MLNLYVAVGGLPDAVNAFLSTKNMNEVSKVYRSILKEYRDDMVKYAPDKDKPHIRECFNSVPKQLAKENKKFQYSKVKPGGRGKIAKHFDCQRKIITTPSTQGCSHCPSA